MPSSQLYALAHHESAVHGEENTIGDEDRSWASVLSGVGYKYQFTLFLRTECSPIGLCVCASPCEFCESLCGVLDA